MDIERLYSIAYKGLKNGLHDYHFEVDGTLFAFFGSTDIKGGKCSVDVVLDRAETMLSLDVSIKGSVVVECDRCLEDCDIPVDFQGRLLVKFSDEVAEYDGEVMWISASQSEVDLAQYIYESIVLSLPYQRVHPEGQCNPAMLERFRIVSGEEFAAIEARAEAEEPSEEQQGEWAKLAELKRQMEAGEKDSSEKTK